MKRRPPRVYGKISTFPEQPPERLQQHKHLPLDHWRRQWVAPFFCRRFQPEKISSAQVAIAARKVSQADEARQAKASTVVFDRGGASTIVNGSAPRRPVKRPQILVRGRMNSSLSIESLFKDNGGEMIERSDT